jgi:hypothetical protein
VIMNDDALLYCSGYGLQQSAVCCERVIIMADAYTTGSIQQLVEKNTITEGEGQGQRQVQDNSNKKAQDVEDEGISANAGIELAVDADSDQKHAPLMPLSGKQVAPKDEEKQVEPLQQSETQAQPQASTQTESPLQSPQSSGNQQPQEPVALNTSAPDSKDGLVPVQPVDEKEPVGAIGRPVYEPSWIRYLQFFSEDDNGVPPGCWWAICPLHHDNWLFNHSWIALYISKFGLCSFDRYRKFYLGIASMLTIITFFITLYGCLALSENRNVVQRTYWYAGTGSNSTDDSEFTIYIGLRSLEQVSCKFVASYADYQEECVRHSISWDSPECHEGLAAPACDTCSEAARGMWLTAFTNCFSLILAWLGAQTRMRIFADCPAQKMLGMWSDTFGVVSLGAALIHFRHSCYLPLDDAYNMEHDISTKFWSGPGFYCYIICCLCGVVRSFAHWLTPVPGEGKFSTLALLLPCCVTDAKENAVDVLTSVPTEQKYAVAQSVSPEIEEV